jgi:DNA-binding response OmpR family regulator
VRVLVIEDHAEMAEAVAAGLLLSQLAVNVALDGTGRGRAGWAGLLA